MRSLCLDYSYSIMTTALPTVDGNILERGPGKTPSTMGTELGLHQARCRPGGSLCSCMDWIQPASPVVPVDTTPEHTVVSIPLQCSKRGKSFLH